MTATGTVVVSLAALYLCFVAHSGLVRYHHLRGTALIAEARQEKATARAELVGRSLQHLLTAERWGLLEDGALQHGIGELLRDQGKFAEAEGRLRRAIELLPRLSYARVALADLLLLRGEVREATGMLETIFDYDPAFPPAVRRYRALRGR
jgi:predicted Zn-dependent protease